MFRLFITLFAIIALPAGASAQSAEIRIAWDPSTSPDVAGYVVDYGTSSGNYPRSVDVGLRADHTFQDLTSSSSYYFAVRAYSSDGTFSARSNEIAYTVPAACTTTLSTYRQDVSALGGDRNVTLITGNGCAWTVGSNATWLTLDPLSVAGSGMKALSYTVAPNPSKQPRFGILYSSNRSVTVVQAGRGSRTTDFDGDGSNDLIWQNRYTGEISLWSMEGIRLKRGEYLSPASVGDTNWKILGTLDADRDGFTDLVLQHDAGEVAIWRMQGAARVEVVSVTASMTLNPQWRIVGTGDMDADGFEDILFQHTDGRVAAWYMDGLQRREEALIATVSDPRWRLAGLADFNDDGKLDLLWRHTAWGQLLVWHMDNRRYVSHGMNLIMANSQWQIVAINDFSGDGKQDLIWRNDATGELAAWFLNGPVILTSISLSPGRVPDTNWRIAGPR